jgi:hypothetical protein
MELSMLFVHFDVRARELRSGQSYLSRQVAKPASRSLMSGRQQRESEARQRDPRYNHPSHAGREAGGDRQEQDDGQGHHEYGQHE